MSVQSALRFIQKVREDETLKAKIQLLGHNADSESIVKIGEEAGYTFSVEHLHTAFKHDWALRWMYYGGGSNDPNLSKPADSESNR